MRILIMVAATAVLAGCALPRSVTDSGAVGPQPYTPTSPELKGYTIHVDEDFPLSDVEAVVFAAYKAPEIRHLPGNLRREILVMSLPDAHPDGQVIVSIGRWGDAYGVMLKRQGASWKIVSVGREVE